METLWTVLVSIVGSTAFWGMVAIALKRRADRGDELQDRHVASFDAVFEAVALLRSSANHVGENYEGGTAKDAEFLPIWECVKKAKDVIETKRLATGPVFADVALLYVKRWEYEMFLLATGRYETEPLKPGLPELERKLFDAIPPELKKRIAPGTLADLQRAAKEAAARKKQMEAQAGLAVVVPPGTPLPAAGLVLTAGTPVSSSTASTHSLVAGTPVEKNHKD